MNLVQPIAPGIVQPANLANNINETTLFTGNGNFTPKTTGNYKVTAKGGGGAGGSGANAQTVGQIGDGGDGGGEGELRVTILALVANTAYPIVIGGGGTGGSGNGPAGTATTFNGSTVALPGFGGNTGVLRWLASAMASGFAQHGRSGHGAGAGAGGVGINVQGVGNPGSNAVANSGAGGGGGGGGNDIPGGTIENGGAGGNGAAGSVLVERA